MKGLVFGVGILFALPFLAVAMLWVAASDVIHYARAKA